jgi:hypothetical protein
MCWGAQAVSHASKHHCASSFASPPGGMLPSTCHPKQHWLWNAQVAPAHRLAKEGREGGGEMWS